MNIGFDIPEGANGIVVIPQTRSKINLGNGRSTVSLSPSPSPSPLPTTKPNHSNHHSQPKGAIEESQEILGLCGTLDYNVKSVFTQNLPKPNPTFYIGRGKVEEIAKFISDNNGLEFAVFDCPLKPNQVFNLEIQLGLRVIDRSTLILMIFLHHARTKEAKLQIEYAILKHQMPYVNELVRRTKLGEHPGLMAGGEYKVDEYYRLTKTRVKTIRLELAKIKTSRAQQRKNRRKKGFVLISFAGYTNAGKSSLLKALTKAQVRVEERMFSTVSPKTRRFRSSKVLFTDTVGFIRDIPTQLIEAFKSTLEEIVDADHILLVVDISEQLPVVKDKLITCLSTIDQLIIERFTPLKKTKKTISGISTGNSSMRRPNLHLVFNKCDLEPEYQKKVEFILSSPAQNLSLKNISSTFKISCKSKFGIDTMIKKLHQIDTEFS